MIPEIGHFALILALCIALIQGTLPLIGSLVNNEAWMKLARPAANAQFLFVLIAYSVLTWSFINNDFSLTYVANHSNTLLPMIYKISGVWGAHEGSLLLWVFLLAIWTAAVSIFSRKLPQHVMAQVISVMGLVSVGFLMFMLFTSNPFERVFPAPVEGRDLNPLLQDPGLAIHPPLLYMGYVGLSVVFAFAISILINGKMNSTWARWLRPWTTVAWIFLTLGIFIGSWWAYYELGWGGWWFWDPVENASFMPWLITTALIHSLAVTEKRNTFQNWTLLLAIFAFSLSLLGTFLVRSGVLTSVHAFANDPARGVFILIFLAITTGGALLLYAIRAPKIKAVEKFQLFSRETILLLNSVILVAASTSILLGTIYPLILDAISGEKISVGHPYFNSVVIPLMLPLFILVGVGPLIRWKSDSFKRLTSPSGIIFVLTTVTVLGLAFASDNINSVIYIAGVFCAIWIVFFLLFDIYLQIRNKPTLVSGLKSLTPAYTGMVLAHLGLAITIVGITISSVSSIEKNLRFAPGNTVEVAGYTFNFDNLISGRGPNYKSATANISVYYDNKLITQLSPEKRIYLANAMPMTEAGIHGNIWRDVYVALGEPLYDGKEKAWATRIYVKPFIRWIWFGGFIMALGGLVAISDRRYRVNKDIGEM